MSGSISPSPGMDRAPVPAMPSESRPATAFLTAHDAAGLLGRYRPALCAFLRRKGFGAEEADDLAQETLIRAYLHLSGFRGMSLDSWLYRIASNVAIDFLRKRRPVTVPLESIAWIGDSGTDLLARLDQEEQRTQVLAAISKLAPCHQQVLQLRYFEDRSLTEIAAELRCTRMAAKLRVFRAVTALRKRVGSELTWPTPAPVSGHRRCDP